MAHFSQDDLKTISECPLDVSILLELNQRAFADFERMLSQNGVPLIKEKEQRDPKDAVSGLLLTLVGCGLASRLHTREPSVTIREQLTHISSHISTFHIATFHPLLRAIAHHKNDVDVWEQASLLPLPSPLRMRLTPPQSVDASSGGTHSCYSTESYQNYYQANRALVDQLRDELSDCFYENVEGFFDKYFSSKIWTQKSQDIYAAIKHTHVDGRWTNFPTTQTALWDWWSQFQDDHLANLPGVYRTTMGKIGMAQVTGERHLDLFVESCPTPSSNRSIWANIRVIGVHIESAGMGLEFLQLAAYARKVFSAQLRRKFVHGFILASTKMELHVFDRSGAFSMQPFDIHEEPERFIKVISGYCTMSDEEIGLDTFVEREGAAKHVTVIDRGGKETRFDLESSPIDRQSSIVGRCTTCYCTQDGESVAKFSWVPSSMSPTQPELLKLANERNVEGVPRLLGSRQIVSTSELRSGLVFFKKRSMNEDSQQNALLPEPNSDSCQNQPASRPGLEVGTKRKNEEPAQSPSKKPCLNAETSRPIQGHQADPRSYEPQSSQSLQTNGVAFVDRVLSCQVTQPRGRPLSEFRNPLELFRALRDAIKAHRSLLLDGKYCIGMCPNQTSSSLIRTRTMGSRAC